MSTAKEIFKKYQAQTFPYPSCLEISSASGCYIYDENDEKYLDFIAGVSAVPLGHNNSKINNAVKKQLDKYSHVMVYGEFIQKPQYYLAKLLSDCLPNKLNTTYFTNSGTEAIEGAIKLAKRITKRSEIISCKNSYHGSTHGTLSIMGNEEYKSNYRPLIPACNQIKFNDIKSLKYITNKTAAVVLEPIQGASGFITPKNNFLHEVRKKCDETKTLLIFDEIQTGFGRLGKIFAVDVFSVVPDILCIAKGMGGGMPIGAFISSWSFMNNLTFQPKLGHITTFGGHPISCTASLETLKQIKNTSILSTIKSKEKVFRKNLKHSKIKEIRGMGLMLAIELGCSKICKKLVDEALNKKLILFYFLFSDTAVRISPPLIISEEEIVEGCNIITSILDEI